MNLNPNSKLVPQVLASYKSEWTFSLPGEISQDAIKVSVQRENSILPSWTFTKSEKQLQTQKLEILHTSTIKTRQTTLLTISKQISIVVLPTGGHAIPKGSPTDERDRGSPSTPPALPVPEPQPHCWSSLHPSPAASHGHGLCSQAVDPACQSKQ